MMSDGSAIIEVTNNIASSTPLACLARTFSLLPIPILAD
jgi:hypothetical protein